MKVAALILTMFLAAVSAAGQVTLGQRKIISEKEYLAAMRKPGTYPLRRGRTESLVEFLNNGAVVESATTLFEGIPPNRVRRVVKMTRVNKITETEQIFIGTVGYQREDGGAWHDVRPPLPGDGSFESKIDPMSSKCNQYFVEAGLFDGMQMSIYHHLAVDEVEGELFFLERREWIGMDGDHYRTEKVEGKLFPREERIRSFATYTYNVPDLKIEAPVK